MNSLIIFIATVCVGIVDSKPAIMEDNRPILCEYKDLTFSPGEGRYLDHVGCKVTVVRCQAGGKVEVEEKHDCSITSTKAPPKATTSSHSTMHPTLGIVCHYEGTYYRPGEIIHEVSHKGVCFGAYCSKYAKVIEFGNVKCNSTTTTTIPPSPTTENSLQIGCVLDGMLYESGEIVSHHQHNKDCVETICQGSTLEKRLVPGNC